MLDYIVAGLMTGKPYPDGVEHSTHKLGHPVPIEYLSEPMLADYCAPFLRSSGNRVLVSDRDHDFGVPVHVYSDSSHVYHRRVHAMLDWAENTAFSRAFFVDVNDCAWACDPFAWWDSLGLPSHLLLIGENHQTYTQCDWLRRDAERLPAEWFEPMVTHGYRPVLTCGTWGARRDVAIDVLTAWSTQIKRTPSVLSDMEAFSYIALQHDYAGMRLTAGLPGITRYDQAGVFQHDRASALRLLEEQRCPRGGR